MIIAIIVIIIVTILLLVIIIINNNNDKNNNENKNKNQVIRFKKCFLRLCLNVFKSSVSSMSLGFDERPKWTTNER